MTAAASPDLWIKLLAPAGGRRHLASVLEPAGAPGEPFAEGRRQSLGNLSRSILHEPMLRADPASVALGYWLRRANLDRMAEAFERRAASTPEAVVVPVGRVFHVAPGNVDTVFVYSWALSYLCGNQNIVRVSGQQGEILSRLLALLASQMEADPELARGNSFLTYDHDQAISSAFSLWANHRVLWGGDETVSLLRGLSLSPHSSERTFGSKLSFSVVSSTAYLAAVPATVERLAAGFFNDIFWFDQMACSSPHLIVWVGPTEAMKQALPRFHDALDREIRRRGYRAPPSSAMHRLSFVFDRACDTELHADLRYREFLPVQLPAGADWTKVVCGGGLFGHLRACELSEVAEFCDERVQTLTHFGFSIDELRTLGKVAGGRGADRLVPVGEALNFEATWDGYDLIGDFLRRVTVRPGPLSGWGDGAGGR